MNKNLFRVAIVAFVLFSAVSLSAAPGDPYQFPSYNPNIRYSFLDSPDKVPEPTQSYNNTRCTVQGKKGSGWWEFVWGPRANSLLTTNNNRIVRDEIIDPMLKKMNDDFAYFRDIMGWPPDRRAKKGYRSTIYLYGSGTGCSDSERDSTAQGGWQSSDGVDPIVLLSWNPVLAFHGPSYSAAGLSNPSYQTEAVVHEGIHAVLASMTNPQTGVATANNIPGWFHEGGNTWLQKIATAQKTNTFGSWADLDGVGYMAPFIPIESYTGWLLDGSFGGPDAEGVNMSGSSGQICTWRTWLGGNQYGNGFPSFLGEWIGNGAIPWIWINGERNGSANGNFKNVLWVMAKGLGDSQMRRLVMEYRSKQATMDIGRWSNSVRNLIRGNHFGQNIGPEWQPSWKPACTGATNEIKCVASESNCTCTERWYATPYAITTNNANSAACTRVANTGNASAAPTCGAGVTLKPDPRTIPGWSGANQIPLKVATNVNEVSIEFLPLGDSMTFQIAYRATDGTAIYSQPIRGALRNSSGTANTATLRLDKRPANDVVYAVIANTDYIYKGDATRKAKYDYRIKLGDGLSTADIYTKWFDLNNMVITAPGAELSSSSVVASSSSRVASSSSRVASSSSRVASSSSRVASSSSRVASSSSRVASSSSSGAITSIHLSQITFGPISVQITTSGIILENLPNKSKVEVYSIQGKRIYSANSINHGTQIPIQEKGIYLVKINNDILRIPVM